MKIKISFTDDNGQLYEGEIELKSKSKSSKIRVKTEKIEDSWYKKGSTIDKIINLANEGFFDKNKTIGEIIDELKVKDYHLKQSDLTLPLRKIVRKGILKRTKDLPDGTKSKQWTYIKP